MNYLLAKRSITLSFALSTVFWRSFFTESYKMSLKSVRNDGIGGRGVTFTPSTGTYKNVVIWMHGLGDTADGWASLMPSLGLSETKFVVPTATNRAISINGGMAMPAWFDIYGLDERAAEDRKGFEESKARIDRIIQTEVDQGIEPQRIVVAGFSQGGAVALHTSLRSTHALGGCIALSTWLPLRDDYPAALSPTAQNLKILQVHGNEDMVVSYPWGEHSHKALSKIVSVPPKFVTIDGMGHSSDPDEIKEVKSFLSSIFDN